MGAEADRSRGDREGVAGARRRVGDAGAGRRFAGAEPVLDDLVRLAAESRDPWRAAMVAADSNTRAGVLSGLQHASGNASVQRMLAPHALRPNVQRQPEDLGDVEDWPESQPAVDLGDVESWPESQPPIDLGDVDNWRKGETVPGLPPMEEPFWNKESADAVNRLGAGVGTLDNWAKLAKAAGANIGPTGEFLEGAGLATDFANYSASGQNWRESAASTTGGYLAGKGLELAAGSPNPIDIGINAANSVLVASGAPESVTDVSSTVAGVTPSTFAKDTGAYLGRGIQNVAEGAITGDWSGAERQVMDAAEGKSGGAIQGYTLVGGLLGDLASGKSLESSLLDVGSVGAKTSALGRMGSWLGDEAFRFINKDLPEASEFAMKDLSGLWDSITGEEEPKVDDWGNPYVQRQEEDEEEVQSTREGADTSPRSDLGSRIKDASRSGTTLDSSIRQRLEGGLGSDLAGVRVHADAEADRLAREMESVAFTSGSDIFFKSGMYNPESSEGVRLLAHEAAHTIQQAQGPVSGTPTGEGVSISDPGDSFELAAKRAAEELIGAS